MAPEITIYDSWDLAQKIGLSNAGMPSLRSSALALGASIPYSPPLGARCSWDRPFTYRFMRSIR